ncbi:PREDICTED: GDSL esterase/lipase 7-like [Nelumbo nucifera]|uniref:GDSL esterase/lipase 7-like n=1 Tax=Nelumbo nucifera TaxID=4432 RepID=A0A1U8Q5V6_NELNU|nr:PREDICTED: GDSL esterase/lipase 7-like [Nelumbo nucifera]
MRICSLVVPAGFSIFFLLFPIARAETPLAPALYVFGDSLVDSGNNNLLPTIAKADFLPYGKDFPGGVTGRFTDGKTVADFVAELLGLPYAPPYLSLLKHNILTGWNYASGSCGILPETGAQFGKCLNLDNQIDLFQKTIRRDMKRQFNSLNELSDYLAKSIFLVSIGSNDYIINYLEHDLCNISRIYSPQAFAQHLTDRLSGCFKRLYESGARRIVMFEIGPIGCMPIFTRKLKPRGPCVEEFNQLVSYFNSELSEMLKGLTTSLQGATFVLAQINKLAYDAITNPSKYGLTDGTNPCCIAGIDGTWPCIPSLSSCPNPDQHFFWDAFHPTQAAYSLISTRCFEHPSPCFPTNIQQLVQV